MADKDDRDTSLSGRSNAGPGRGSSPGGPSTSSRSSSGSSASNSRSDTPSSGRSTGSSLGGSGSGNSNSRSSTAGGAGPGRGSSPGGQTVGRSTTSTTPSGYGFGGNRSVQAARADTPSSGRTVASTIGAPRSATPPSSLPDFMKGIGAPPSRMTAPAGNAPTEFTRTPAGVTAQDLVRQASTLTTRPADQFRAMTTKARMDAMEQMRQVATAPAAAPRGLGTPIDNASIDRLTAAIGTGAVPSARVSPQAPAGYDPSLTPVGIDAARVHARAAQDRAIAADAFAQNTPVAAGTPLGGYPNVTTPALNTQRADLQQSFRAQENADLSGVKSINFDPRSQPNRTTVAASMQTPTSVAGSPTQVAANRPANTPAQVAMTTRSRSPGPAPKANPATGVDVLTPARQATEYARAQYTPARSQVATNELGVETVGNTGMTQAQIDVAAAQVGSQTSVDDEDQTVAANEDTDTAPAVTQPPPKETFNPKTIKTVTATGVEKPATLTQALKDVFSRKKDSKPRGLKGNLAVLAGDLAMGAAGPVGLFNAGVQIATGKSIPGHIWSATHGEYGPNQYKGSQHTGTSNREATSTTKPVAEPRPNTADEEPGTTFEEKYLAFNDPTWRPTPLQRFGKVEPTWTPPTHPYTS